MAKSGFEKLMEKAGILMPATPEESMDARVPKKEEEGGIKTSDQFLNEEKATNNTSSDVVSEVYSTLPQSAENIYIVEELLKNFGMLPDESKKGLVRSTLETMDKDIDKFIMEANTKKTALANGLAKYVQKVSADLMKLEETIKQAEEEISKARQAQLDRKNSAEKQKVAVGEEIKRLEMIIEVLGGK